MPLAKTFILNRLLNHVKQHIDMYFIPIQANPLLKMGGLALLTFMGINLFSSSAFAIDGDLKTQITAINTTLISFGRPILWAVMGGVGAMSIYKQNVAGMAIAGIGGIVTYQLGKWIETQYALVM